MSKTDLPMLQQRRIEANILKPVYEEMESQLGTEKAQEILGAAVIKDSISQGAAYAEGLEDRGLKAFRDTMAIVLLPWAAPTDCPPTMDYHQPCFLPSSSRKRSGVAASGAVSRPSIVISCRVVASQ